MLVNIEGIDYEIPDEEVRAHIAEVDGATAEEQNKFVFGIHVNHTQELVSMGDDIARFMSKVGEGVVEVQVSVNAKLVEHKDMVVGFNVSHLQKPAEQLEPAIGDAHPTEFDEDYDDNEEEDY